MTYDALLKSLQSRKFHPIYFLYGEEPYFIDQVDALISGTVLQDFERDFNYELFYAKDTDPQVIINSAMQYPSFAERRVVVVREAQDFKAKDWEVLEKYFLKPVDSTILLFCHKYKALDKRTRVAKTIEKHSVFFESAKIRDEDLPEWIIKFSHVHRLRIARDASVLLAENLGNDLSRIANEVEKLKLLLADDAEITPEVIEKWIGISKEYNVTEFNKAIIQHNFNKAMKMVLYFEKNPKAGNIIPIVAFLFQYFSRLFIYHYNKDKSDGELKGMGLYYLSDYRNGARFYSLAKTEKIINLLNEYDAKAKGLYATGNMSNGDLLRELTFRILH